MNVQQKFYIMHGFHVFWGYFMISNKIWGNFIILVILGDLSQNLHAKITCLQAVYLQKSYDFDSLGKVMSLINFYLGWKCWIDGSHFWEKEMAQKRWELCKKQKLSFHAWIVKSFELLIPPMKLRYVLIKMSTLNQM